MKYKNGLEHELELAATRHLLYTGTLDELMLRAADEIAKLREVLHPSSETLDCGCPNSPRLFIQHERGCRLENDTNDW